MKIIDKIFEKFSEPKIPLRYGYFESPIKALSKYPMWKTPTMKELDFTKSMTQLAYRYMKEMELDGDVIDFLCILSTHTVLNNFEQEWKSNKAQYEKYLSKGHAAKDKWMKDLLDPFDTILMTVTNPREDEKNFLRLSFRNPQYILKQSRVVLVLVEVLPRTEEFVPTLREDIGLGEGKEIAEREKYIALQNKFLSTLSKSWLYYAMPIVIPF